MRREPRPALLAILLVAGFLSLAMPRPVAACWCVPPDVILEEAVRDADSRIFTAVIGPSTGSETSATVTRWFKGGLPLPIVIFDVERFAESSCGTATPPMGAEYLFAMPLEGNRGHLHSCSLLADLAAAEGQAMLARVMEAGPATVPTSTDPPPSPAATDGNPTVVGLAVSVLGAAAPLGVAIAFGLGLIGGLVLILRRREDGGR